MHILVTGGAGYLGSVLVPELLAAGYAVTVIDNFTYGQTSLLDCCSFPGFTMVRGDARDRQLIKQHLKQADAIIPLACLTGAPLCDRKPLDAKAINYDAINLLLELRDSSQRIIFPTTNSGYGIGQNGIYCTEETPLNPITLYGRLKVASEKAVLNAGNSITLRLATVFGPSPRMRLDLLVNDFTYRAMADRFVVLFQAHFKRNYIHIRDVAHAFIHCLQHFDTMQAQPYNVGLSDANLSKWELCELIKEQVPDFYFCEAAVGEDPDKRNYIVSNQKIEASGFAPRYGLSQGVTELLKVFQIIRKDQYSNL